MLVVGCLKTKRLRSSLLQRRGYFIETVLQYSLINNYTKVMEFFFNGIHGLGLSWPLSISLSGCTLRILSSPTHIYAEKLYAKQTVAVTELRRTLIEKIAEHHHLPVTVSSNGTCTLSTTDRALLHKSNRLVDEYVYRYLTENRLKTSRILNLRVSVAPIWFFASLALRNIVYRESVLGMSGALWFPDLLQPDPLFILPVGVGVLGFCNLLLSRRIYGNGKAEKLQTIFVTVFMLTITAVLLKTPACFSLYWFVVGLTALIETQALRYPKFKKIFGIHPLPSDITPSSMLKFLPRKLLKQFR